MVEESPVGKTLKQRTKKYSVRYDSNLGVWRILDLWHPSLETLGPGSEVTDDSEALTLLPHSAFEALLEEANRIGILSKYVDTVTEREGAPTVKTDKVPVKVQLAKMGIDAILKLIGVVEVDELIKGKK
jgi:hypothetical protein